MQPCFIKYLFRIAIIAAVTGTLHFAAQNASAMQNDDEAAESLKSELQSFAKSEIIPSLTEWKNRLDGSMNATDLNELNQLRVKAKELKTAFRAELKIMRKAWKSEDYDALKQSRTKIKDMKEQRDELFEAVAPLAKKYKETLVEIGSTAKPKMEQWRKRGREIVANWQEKNPDADIHPRFLMGAMKQWGLKKMGKKVAAIRFMLWDGSAEFGAAEDESELPEIEGQTGANPMMQVLPNPFSTATTIRVTLPSDQTITLAVYDAGGRQIAVLADGFFTAGEHSFRYEVPTESASGGQYCLLENVVQKQTLPLNFKQ